MGKTGPGGELLVSGHAIVARLSKDFFRSLGADLRMVCAHKQARLLDELERRKPPVCITEHMIPSRDPVEDFRRFFGEDTEHFVGLGHHYMSKAVAAHELLPELLALSPTTKFIITCHNRGFGVPKEERELYKRFPEVLKVMGFANSDGNRRYLLRTLSRIYLGKTWKPKGQE